MILKKQKTGLREHVQTVDNSGNPANCAYSPEAFRHPVTRVLARATDPAYKMKNGRLPIWFPGKRPLNVIV